MRKPRRPGGRGERDALADLDAGGLGEVALDHGDPLARLLLRRALNQRPSDSR